MNMKRNNPGLRFAVCGLRLKDKGRRTPDKALTFVELLIVTALLAMISLAVYAVFNSGIKIWQRVNRSVPGEDVNIFFDKFRTDIKNSFAFKGIDFSGEEDRLEFPTIVDSPRLKKRTVGQVIYSYDSREKILAREERDIAHIYGEEKGPVTQALKYVESLTFLYRRYDENEKVYIWEEKWKRGRLPVALRIRLEFNDGTEVNKITRTIDLPSSGSL